MTPSPTVLPLLLPFPLWLLPLHVGLPQLVVLGQLHHQHGGQILNSGVVRQTGRKAGNGLRELFRAGFSLPLQVLNDFVDLRGTNILIPWKRIALMQKGVILGGNIARRGGGKVGIAP